ncbi:peptidoglycan-binding domain-containing protein [Psychromarinibacter sp. C21-152]|uniref:Peptidoglycan-binding domain-containing protein n=1 Tax=Psychromarinibacter sediminicola TaxID=3033385 RepID=A0AAE3NQU5_9RHOB|nr:peptidoglycan-binding domain-containing protein [Psychromarinibacter sediminicola]MDF0601843.1 peptidoglycan-binding domain-containing protein [Psychromarinibacter sediminicola]
MRHPFARILIALAMLAAAGAARAENLALIVANNDYRNYPRAENARALLDLVPFLNGAGFRTIVVENLDSATLARRLPDIGRELARADRIIVVTHGHYARMQGDSWLLTTDADAPDSFTVGRYGLSFEALYNVARRNAGDALIAVAVDNDAPEIGWSLRRGFRSGDIPNGVTVATGVPSRIADFLRGGILSPGMSVADAVRAAPDGVNVDGYIPRARAFLPASAPVVPPDAAERALWQQAVDGDSPASYARYLRRYPTGRFAQEARARIDELSATPEDRAREQEVALNLDRDRRRHIQEYLTLLGYDTRGVDGVFGPNTRGAIRRFQNDVGANATGYLTANQVARIEQEGAARAEELRREAERRRAEEERRDRDWWRRTGADGTEDGYRAYLQRYPDGLFSDRAKAGLDRIEREKRQAAAEAERRAWDSAVNGGTIASYRQYLSEYPNGRFAAEARARIDSLSAPETPAHVVEAARDEERSLNLDPFRRRMIESQLAEMELQPGTVDGDFTDSTRRALRRFQRMSNLPATGYVTRDTIVRLLISAVGR